MNVYVVTMYMYCEYYSGTLEDQHHECVCSHYVHVLVLCVLSNVRRLAP